ncbi:hypothetical protein ZIOFF_013972 [Zingiber officinale]|uniref:Uncharacterized protein n=1 Tax=Zingiber officinale TaxID=94328 RepID=A0A8J5HGQ6_ZINOF|nr:hypothetical protein ZIOFF_013972 [Zingiber officinale]
MNDSISLSFLGYQATKNPQARRLSSFDTEELRNEGEEEFAGVFISFIEGYGQPDTTERWDTLGEPSGRYDYYVNYTAPPIQPFIPATKLSWGDENEDEDQHTDNEAVFPSIWEDTPWEDDPYFEIEDLPVAEEPYTDEAEEEREAYFLGLKDLENDYPTISSISVLLGENQALPIHWDNSDDESNNYWQQIVEQAEQQWSVTQNLTEGVNELTIQDDTTSVEGVDIKFEHIEGVNNELADTLSRLVHHIANKATLSENQIQLLSQVGDSVEETQDANDMIKGVLGRTIMALFTKVTPVKDTGN